MGVGVEVALRRNLQRAPLAVGDAREVVFVSVEERTPGAGGSGLATK